MQYLITVTAYLPYPIAKEFRVEAGSYGTAINRAVKQYRGYVKKKSSKSKHIDKLAVSAIKL